MTWGLVEPRYLEDCADDVRRLAVQGRTSTLGQMLVARGFLSVETYQNIVARLHQEYGEASPQVQRATEQIPFMNQSGRYTKTFQVPQQMDDSAVERAVKGWGQQADVVTASGSDLNVAGGSQPSAPTRAPADRAPADRAIRKRLKIPKHMDRFPIGLWIVEQYVDTGNWGIVYRVTPKNGGTTPYALKILKQHDPSEEVRQRFIQEARTMFKLRHRGIVRVHDAGVISDMLWYVMDFLEGPNLKEVLEEQGKLEVREALEVVKLICAAVSYAHSQAILHRDLKPENVIMVGGTDPVLTDFGLAKDEQSTMNLTQEGQRIGTPLYMAPELLLNSEQATHQSEVYSLGAMLYQCLSGKVPYEAKSIFDLVDKIEEGKLPPLAKVCRDAPKKLDKVLKRALNKDAKKRPKTVAEFAMDLEGL